MTPEQVKKALKMYKAWQCDTREYRELAESMGLNTGELNQKCWWILHPNTDRKFQ